MGKILSKEEMEIRVFRKKQIEKIAKTWTNRVEKDRHGNDILLTIEVIAERMLSNNEYDPYNEFCLPWDYRCHSRYAVASLQERYAYFAQEVYVYRKHIQGRVYGDQGSIIVEAVTMADRGKFLYEDWILAQICFFMENCWVHHLRGSHASRITKQWIKEGRYVPPILMIDF